MQFNPFQLYAQKGKKEKNCESSCFQTEIIQVENLGSCRRYELEVSHMGNCTFALSHFTVAVPCGTIANVSNSENWPIETDVLDPKTQLYGFKVDNIRDFGEADAPQKFRVSFEVCPTDETCTQTLSCWEPVVAYKAGQCIHYDTISADCQTTIANLLTGTLSVQNPASSGNNDGYIHLSVEGGAGSYTFIWSNGDTTQNLEGVEAGTYSVTIVDALGNQLTLDTVLEPEDNADGDGSPEGDTSGDSSSNTGDDTSGGSSDDSADSGSGGSSDDGMNSDGSPEGDTSGDSSSNTGDDTSGGSSDDSADSGSDESNDGSTGNNVSCADCYQMKILTQEKSGNCTYYEIEVKTDGTCSPSISQPFTGILTTQKPSCWGNTDGFIQLSIEGGTAPYTFTWSNGATTQNLEGIGAGSYSVTVVDTSGNQLTLDTTLDEPEAISLSYSITPTSCSGPADGSIALQVHGGNAPYDFSWSDGITTQNRENLSAGVYQVEVTDQSGCSTTASITVNTGSTIIVLGAVANANCGVGNDGAIDLTMYGGIAPYTFSWNNGKTTEDINSLSAGIYSVQVTDAKGCTALKSFSVKTNTSLSVSANETRTSCTDNASGAIDLTINSGTAPFTFSWSNGETTEDISGLTAGYYSVEISDANGCGTSYSTYIRKNVLYFTYEAINPSCPGESDGEIHIFPPDDRDIYTYTWSMGATAQNVTGLSSGYYYVTITDTSGCSSSRYIAVEDPAPITIEYSIVNQECSENLSADLDLIVSGGTSSYTFIWSSGETSEDLIGIGEGSYEVMVTDSNSCMTSATIPVNISCDSTDSTGGTNQDNPEDNSGGTGDDMSSGGSGDNNNGTDNPDNFNDGAEFMIAIPCGSVSNVSNSGDWIVESNVTDTVTGFTGFKIDNIQNFGENQQPESFTVSFTICSDESVCQETLNCWQPVVTYKSGQCITYDTLQASCDLSSAFESATLTTYPNPIEVIDEAVVEFTLDETSFVTLELYDLSGNLITTLFEGEAEQGTHQVSLEGLTLKGDIYICKLITSDEIITQRIILPQ